VCTGYVPVEDGECADIPYVEEEEDAYAVCEGLDNDCDGMVDDGCDCEPNESYRCYLGAAEHAGVGRCDWGQQEGCTDSGERTVCDEGTYKPKNEQCGDEVDNDCDGETDSEDYDCR